MTSHVIPAPRVNLDVLARQLRAAFDEDAAAALEAVTELKEALGQERAIAAVNTLWEIVQRSFMRVLEEELDAIAPDPEQHYEFPAVLRPKMPMSRDKDNVMTLEIGFTLSASRDRAMDRFAEPLRLGLAGPTYCRVIVQPLARQARLPEPPAEPAPPEPPNGQIPFEELIAGVGDEEEPPTDPTEPAEGDETAVDGASAEPEADAGGEDVADEQDEER